MLTRDRRAVGCYYRLMSNGRKAWALRKKAISYLASPKIDYGNGELPDEIPEAEAEKIRAGLRSADPDERMRIDLEVMKIWHQQLQRQHSDLLMRRAHLMESAQASTLQHISIAMGISMDQIDKSASRIADLESRLGDGEVVEPARVIKIKGGGTVEG